MGQAFCSTFDSPSLPPHDRRCHKAPHLFHHFGCPLWLPTTFFSTLIGRCRSVNDEGRLIAQTLDGDASAFEQLVRRYQDRLFTSFVHVTGCHAEAEDVVQEAFIQAYLNLKQFRGQSGFYTWLYRIAFNRAITRKRQTRPTLSTDQVSTAPLSDRVAQSETPGQRLERLELAEQVAKALGRISEEHRAILVLRELEGFDYQEISEILQISLGTVRSRLSRARAILRQHLPDPPL